VTVVAEVSNMGDRTHNAVIREVEPSDLPRLLELLHQLSESSEHPEARVRPPVEAHGVALRQIMADPNVRMVVIEEDESVVGTLTLYLLPNLSHGGRPFAIVENVVVDGSGRNGGYGRLLMDYAMQAAVDAGCYKVSLTSNMKRAPAHAFYERLGYRPTHRGFTWYLEGDAAGIDRVEHEPDAQEQV